MKKTLNMVGIIAALLLCLELVYLVGIWTAYSRRLIVTASSGQLDVKRSRASIARAFSRSDGAGVYAQFKSEVRTRNAEISHGAAHIFGEELYRHDGLKGITVCDGEIGFGCYHGFFSKVISKTGEAGVLELDRLCVKKYGSQGLGCAHGLGHGLGEYLGAGKLSQQLEICGKLTWQGRFFGCKEGVFMEYNMPVEKTSDAARLSLRPMKEDEPYGPCLTVDAAYQPACYMELSNWWGEVFRKDYAHIGGLCSRVPVAINREACFLGVGYIEAPKDSYSVVRTREVCAAMPGPDAELLCRAGASWSFFASPDHRNQAQNLCTYESHSATEECLKKSDLLGY